MNCTAKPIGTISGSRKNIRDSKANPTTISNLIRAQADSRITVHRQAINQVAGLEVPVVDQGEALVVALVMGLVEVAMTGAVAVSRRVIRHISWICL